MGTRAVDMLIDSEMEQSVSLQVGWTLGLDMVMLSQAKTLRITD